MGDGGGGGAGGEGEGEGEYVSELVVCVEGGGGEEGEGGERRLHLGETVRIGLSEVGEGSVHVFFQLKFDPPLVREEKGGEEEKGEKEKGRENGERGRQAEDAKKKRKRWSTLRGHNNPLVDNSDPVSLAVSNSSTSSTTTSTTASTNNKYEGQLNAFLKVFSDGKILGDGTYKLKWFWRGPSVKHPTYYLKSADNILSTGEVGIYFCFFLRKLFHLRSKNLKICINHNHHNHHHHKQ